MGAGTRGAYSPFDDAAAVADATASVAYLDSGSSEYIKDVIYQYVYNESLAGRWQHISRMWVAKTDLASAYKCIKTGNLATPSATLAYNAQSGIRITGTNKVNFNYDVSADYADATDYAIGTAFNTVSSGPANTTWTLLKGMIGSTTAIVTGWHPTSDGYQGVINGGVAEGPTGTTLDTCYSSISRIDIDPVSGNARYRCGDVEGISPYIFGTASPTSIKQNDNSVPGSSSLSLDQTWEMTYMASSAMEWEGFRDNTNTMLAALALLAPAFTAPIQDGDSLELDNSGAGYSGWVSALTQVSTSDMVINGYGGKTLKYIAATADATNGSLDLAIAANPTADSLIIGGGINDIINGGLGSEPVDSEATIKTYIDSIFTQYASASNLTHLLVREITASGGRYDAQRLPAMQVSRWQPLTDNLNAYLATKVAAATNAYLVGAYTATESSEVAYADYQEGLVRSTPATVTGGTTGDGDLTVDGVHWKPSGAALVASLGDAILAPFTFYKGGRP